jgi:hypothetical protein
VGPERKRASGQRAHASSLLLRFTDGSVFNLQFHTLYKILWALLIYRCICKPRGAVSLSYKWVATIIASNPSPPYAPNPDPRSLLCCAWISARDDGAARLPGKAIGSTGHPGGCRMRASPLYCCCSSPMPLTHSSARPLHPASSGPMGSPSLSSPRPRPRLRHNVRCTAPGTAPSWTSASNALRTAAPIHTPIGA